MASAKRNAKTPAKMKNFPLTIVAKHSILDGCQGLEYTSVNVAHLISIKLKRFKCSNNMEDELSHCYCLLKLFMQI